MFSLEITTDNAAFDDNAGEELTRILHRLADRLASEVRIAPNGSGEWIAESGKVTDVNGNAIGVWHLTEPA